MSSTARRRLLEADVTKQCKGVLTPAGWTMHRLHSGKLRGKNDTWVSLNPAGTPDWLCIRPIEPGVTQNFYMELKRPDEKAQAHQADKLQKLTDAGFLTTVIDSVDALKEFLQINF